jgi:DNA-directed RNA polymerase subunit beta'
MILDVIPVIPPDLRPMVQLDGGRFATTDLNDLYRRIINRNNRLKSLYNSNAPHLITKNEKRLLQESVDALIDNAKRPQRNANDRNNNLKSLSDMLRGKQGRFRQNLLGKRVDYSGRSVIVVGPSLEMYQCGLPKEMALTLFKPFVIRDLLKKNTYSIGTAKKLCEKQDSQVWPILENVIREHPVLLNRAPTLHRLGIQAFEPILIEGKAIRLHPLVCPAFNADFDGDQMAVHVPLSLEAQAEARLLMLASNNILNPKDGAPVSTPSQDMILGNYYLSLERAYRQGHSNTLPKGAILTDDINTFDVDDVLSSQRYDQVEIVATGDDANGYDLYRVAEHEEGKFYTSFSEAYLAYKNDEITLHTRIFVDPKNLDYGNLCLDRFKGLDLNGKYLFTTVGKLIFNNILSKDFPYVNDGDAKLGGITDEKYLFNPKTDKVADFLARPESTPFKKKFLSKIIAEVFKRSQLTETSKMLDRLKNLGFKYSTIAGITISIADIDRYSHKDEELAAANNKVEEIKGLYDFGLMTESERYSKVCAVWQKTRDDVENGLWNEMKQRKDNAIFMMADSGSRGSSSNFAQIAGMRGLMADTNGRPIEVPVTSNFYEGLTVSEFFISSHGSRKGSTDTALKTAESGYLTRRLVDVSQDVIVTMNDCGTTNGFPLHDLRDDDDKVLMTLGERCVGRYPARDIINPANGEVIVHRNELVTDALGKAIDAAGIQEAYIRTNLTCAAPTGLCTKCYGLNLATNTVVEVGEAVGVIAAQSIGEPGTQLTMRTFHNGGVASGGDITQGLPRVQELFEARKPKGKATLSEIDGVVTKINKTRAGSEITISNETTGEEISYKVDNTAELLVAEGSKVTRGDRLMKGRIAPKELLRIKDKEAVQRYIVDEVQKPYKAQGVSISDKHIEIIVRQMLRKLVVISEGDSKLLPGLQYSIHEFNENVVNLMNDSVQSGTMHHMPVARPVLLGITKAALGSDSFLSASSFQETTRALTDAVIRGKKDYLLGLKENVIIGGLIPAGTGILEEEEFQAPAPKYMQAETETMPLASEEDREDDELINSNLSTDDDVETESIEDEIFDDEETEEI